MTKKPLTVSKARDLLVEALSQRKLVDESDRKDSTQPQTFTLAARAGNFTIISKVEFWEV